MTVPVNFIWKNSWLDLAPSLDDEFNHLRFLTIKNVSKIYASVAVNLH